MGFYITWNHTELKHSHKEYLRLLESKCIMDKHVQKLRKLEIQNKQLNLNVKFLQYVYFGRHNGKGTKSIRIGINCTEQKKVVQQNFYYWE